MVMVILPYILLDAAEGRLTSPVTTADVSFTLSIKHGYAWLIFIFSHCCNFLRMLLASYNEVI